MTHGGQSLQRLVSPSTLHLSDVFLMCTQGACWRLCQRYKTLHVPEGGFHELGLQIFPGSVVQQDRDDYFPKGQIEVLRVRPPKPMLLSLPNVSRRVPTIDLFGEAHIDHLDPSQRYIALPWGNILGCPSILT